MDIVKLSIFVAGALLCCSLAVAGDMESITTSQGLRPIVSLQGGYASINARNGTQRFTNTDDDVFTYTSAGSRRNAGFLGVFLGAEHSLPWVSYPALLMEAGIEYNAFRNIGVKGTNTVGVESQTSTTYQYSYNFQTQQVLGMLKLFATAYERFHPYGEIGLGAAFNHAGRYNATTTETGSINLTPSFNNQSKTQFSYSLGLGVDAEVNRKIRVGLEYRYSNFGSSSLKNGTVTFNNYQSPVSFALGNSHTYANQLMAHISYVV